MESVLLAADAGDEAGLYRQLGRGQGEGLLRHLTADAVQLEHHTSRLHPRSPPLRGALAGSHPHFLRLLGDGYIRKDPNPQLADTTHVARDRPACRFDLACRNPPWARRLEAIGTEVQLGPALGHALDAALMLFAVLCPLRRQHRSRSLTCSTEMPVCYCRAPLLPGCDSAMRLSCAMGSWAMTSPSQTHTLTPQVPQVVRAAASPQ